jgi:hypothetical protein
MTRFAVEARRRSSSRCADDAPFTCGGLGNHRSVVHRSQGNRPHSGEDFVDALDRGLGRLGERLDRRYRSRRPGLLIQQMVIAVAALVGAIVSFVTGEIARGIFLLLAGSGILAWSVKEFPAARQERRLIRRR